MDNIGDIPDPYDIPADDDDETFDVPSNHYQQIQETSATFNNNGTEGEVIYDIPKIRYDAPPEDTNESENHDQTKDESPDVIGKTYDKLNSQKHATRQQEENRKYDKLDRKNQQGQINPSYDYQEIDVQQLRKHRHDEERKYQEKQKHLQDVNLHADADEPSPYELPNFDEAISNDVQETRKDRTNRGDLPKLFTFNDMYIRKNWDGRLKVLEFIATLLAVAFLPSTYFHYHTRFIFHRFVTVTCLFFIVLDLFLHLFSIWERIPTWIVGSLTLMFATVLAGISLLASSCLIIVKAEETSDESRTLASAFFGFAGMVVFGTESVLHFLRYRTDFEYTSQPVY